MPELSYRDLEEVFHAAKQVVELRPQGPLVSLHAAMNDLEAIVTRLSRKEGARV